MPAWIYRFEELGGTMVYEEAGIPELEKYEKESDLVLVASGKGEISKLLERDDDKCRFDKPMRGLGLAYVNGLEPFKTRDHGVVQRGLTWNGRPGIGELFTCNALTTSGECDILIYEAIPGSPADILDTREGPEQYLENCKKVIKEFYPEQWERAENMTLTDDLGILSGRFPPTIRKPVMKLPNGKVVMGIADAVCLNDPITGQGSCNASKFAKVVYDAILNHTHKDFDGQWMQDTFDAFLEKGQYCVQFTNDMLVEPTPAMQKLLWGAGQSQEIADLLFAGLDKAERLFPYWTDEKAVDELLARFVNSQSTVAA
jgi:hypothetical protein